jgi:hypothetical protein
VSTPSKIGPTASGADAPRRERPKTSTAPQREAREPVPPRRPDPTAHPVAVLRATQHVVNLPAFAAAVSDPLTFQRMARAASLPTPRMVAVVARHAWGWSMRRDRPLAPRAWEAAFDDAGDEIAVRGLSGDPPIRLRRRGDSWSTPWGPVAAAAEVGVALEATRDGAWVIEEDLHDHPALARLGGGSAHVVRVVTTIDESGHIGLHLPALRMARRAPEGVEPWAPIVGGRARIPAAEAAESVAGTLAYVPCWDDVVALSVRTAEALSPLRTLAVTMVVTPHGPVLLAADPAWRGLPGEDLGDVLAVLGTA